MKATDYLKIEETLMDVIEKLNDMYSSVDTSYNVNSKYEHEKDIEEWNEKLNKTISNLRELNEEMIFIFDIMREDMSELIISNSKI